jgi:PhnB protein
MADQFKPEGYPSASPYLIVDDAHATIDFLAGVFDGKVIRRHSRPDGRIAHAEVQIDDSVIMLGEAVEGWPAQPANIHVYVKDVDAVYQRALDAGAESLQAPEKRDDPDRRSGVKDAGGNSWWIATMIDPEA